MKYPKGYSERVYLMKKIMCRLSPLVLVLALLVLGGCHQTPDATTTDPAATEASSIIETTEALTTAPETNEEETTVPETTEEATTAPETTVVETTVEETTVSETTAEETTEDETSEEFAAVTATVVEIAKYGNLVLDMTGAELYNLGYEYGDVLEVSVAGHTWEVPFCSNYSDVDNGVTVLRAVSAEDVLVLAINMGDLATTAGIAEKTAIEEEPGYRWDYLIQTPVQVTITMKQENGYREQWLLHQLVGSVVRTDYEHLSDEAFANFRVIDTTGMGEKVLYRSSSPINPGIGRNIYADKAAREAGIVTVINLADASNTYGSSADTYYLTCQVTYLNLGMDFLAEDSVVSLAQGMRVMIEGEAPFLIHCNEGKDRAGFVSALLECLMGASLDEVVEDYMETYFNYYGVEKDSEKYAAVVNNTLIPALKNAFGVTDLEQSDLVAEAEAYLMENLGLSADEVTALKAKLGG